MGGRLTEGGRTQGFGSAASKQLFASRAPLVYFL